VAQVGYQQEALRGVVQKDDSVRHRVHWWDAASSCGQCRPLLRRKADALAGRDVGRWAADCRGSCRELVRDFPWAKVRDSQQEVVALRVQRDALLRRQERQRRGEYLPVVCQGELKVALPDVLEYFLPEPSPDAGELANSGARQPTHLAARKRYPAQQVAPEAHPNAEELNLVR
jgi:hypothetical protein